MKDTKSTPDRCCQPRRAFLSDLGMGFTGLALGSMLHGDGIVRAESTASWTPPDGKPHFPPKAKSVIWLFMIGGVSHIESFDPKPALNKYAGKTAPQTPFQAALDHPFPIPDNLRQTVSGSFKALRESSLFPMQVGYRKCGQSGIEVSDWWPHVRECVDDIAIVRSMWTSDNNHGGQLQFHTGRHVREGAFPTVGSWVHYGLGSLNDNLPQFIVLGEPLDTCCGGQGAHGSGYLGPEHSGVRLAINPENPLSFGAPESAVYREEQERQVQLIHRLNELASVEYPGDPVAAARIRSYELAFRMQMAVPELFRFKEEPEATQKLYGLDAEPTKSFGEACLTARRLVERGVRFVQIYHGSNGGAGAWDAHSNLKKSHATACSQVDRPIAGLLQDLKQRGLLDETIVVFGTEFGRTPGAQGANGTGRDHHPFGFSVWMAGGGIKPGVVHGATDELGLYAIENRHYVTDVHATVLHQLGLDPHRLQYPGRKRLEIDYGKPIEEIIRA